MTRLSAKDAQVLLGQPKRSKHGNKPVWECEQCGLPYHPLPEAFKVRKPIFNKGCSCGGRIVMFASQREYKRWKELQRLEKAGRVRNLKRQIPIRLEIPENFGGDWGMSIVLTPKGRPMKYIADFFYEEPQGDQWQKVAEDAKGRRAGTAYDLFWLKREIIRLSFGYEIREV